MSFSAGTELGVYEILSVIGAGGMGEVYKARDRRLNRDVAIKILPPLVAQDPDRRARFDREAQALASLNHPHIAQIYGVEDSGGVPSLVMEFVDGPTLADRLAEGLLEIEEAIRIARQMADGLEAAHEAGIIHRDLKPANIKVRPDGTVKVLDFGLAKVSGEGSGKRDRRLGDSADSPTLTSPAMTLRGVILGTAAYMAPEQARGQAVDKRADIWAFGCVLFEMLTGRRLFPGDTVSDTLAAVLTRDISLDTLSGSTPATVRHVLTRCLDRDPKTRLRDIGEARVLLGAARVDAASARGAPTTSWSRVAALLGAILGASLMWVAGARNASAPATRFVDLGLEGYQNWPAVLSPDGTTVAYTTPDALMVRRLSRPTSERVVAHASLGSLTWSPDGTALAFFTDSDVRTIQVDGGNERVLLPEVPRPDRGVWWTGNALFLSRNGIITRVPVDGTAPSIIATPDKAANEFTLRFSATTADGQIVFTNPGVVSRDQFSFATVVAIRGTERKRIATFANAVVYWLAYDDRAAQLIVHTEDPERHAIWAVPFDERALSTTAAPRLLTEGQWPSAPSADGSLLYSTGRRPHPRTLLWFDQTGKQTGVVEVGRFDLRRLAVSPDGRRASFSARATLEAAPGLWVQDLERHTQTLVDPALPNSVSGAWSPDSLSVAFVGSDRHVRVARVDAAHAPAVIAQDALATELAWTPDGQRVVFIRGNAASGQLVSVPASGGPEISQGTIDGLRSIALSRQGLLAYTALEASEERLFVTTFPELTQRVPAIGGVAVTPEWHGRELWFVHGDAVKAATIDLGKGGALSVTGLRTVMTARSEAAFLGFGGNKSWTATDSGRLLLFNLPWSGQARLALIENVRSLYEK